MKAQGIDVVRPNEMRREGYALNPKLFFASIGDKSWDDAELWRHCEWPKFGGRLLLSSLYHTERQTIYAFVLFVWNTSNRTILPLRTTDLELIVFRKPEQTSADCDAGMSYGAWVHRLNNACC